MSLFDTLTQIDGNLLIGIQQTLHADWFTSIMKFITSFGNYGWASITLCLILILYRKTRRLGIVCGASVLLTFCCCSAVLKPIVDRARPWEVLPDVMRMIPDPGDSSFPSGHTSNSMAIAFSFWLNTRPGRFDGQNDWDESINLEWAIKDADRRKLHKWSYLLIVFALLIGLSRIYLGMHFPSDVITGILVAVICSQIVYLIKTKLEMRNDIARRQQ